MTSTAAGDVVRAATPLEQDAGPTVQARLFGPLTVSIDGHVVDLARWGRVRRLLAYLLVHPRPVPTRELQRQLWPGSSDRAARNCLHVTVSKTRAVLREACQSPVVHFANGTYQLAPDVRCITDLDVFEACVREAGALVERAPARAIEQLRAAVLASAQVLLSDDDGSPWVLDRRELVGAKCVDARLLLGELLIADGAASGSLELARSVLTHDGCNERAHRLAMSAHAALGERARTWEQYARCRAALRKAHGLEPAVSTTALLHALAAPPSLFDQ
jgi:DNA-binding SARP family transcriptional activator